MKHRHRAGAALAAVCCAAVPATADAATREVYMGTPPSIAKQMQDKYLADANAFFPSTTRIHVGDTVRFVPVGFHNASFPKKGAKPNAALVPTGKQLSGETDAAGAPFWFNGQPEIGFNGALFASGLFGKTATYDGSKLVDTGMPVQDKPKPANVRFTKRGTFTYYCSLHPGMKGKVSVVAKSASAPSSKAQKAAIARQAAKALKTAQQLAKKPAPKNVIDVGVAGSGGVERLAFSPSTITAKVGDTLTFQMSPGSYDVHTATTGPGDADKADTYLGKIVKEFEDSPVFKGIASYPSDPRAAGAAALSPALHGNGFWNTGLIDRSSSSSLPQDGSVRIAAPGTYTFVCLIHPFMKATVTATA